MSQPQTFTGRARRRTTRPAIKVKDKIAHAVITIGGIGTILAVLGVAVFLAWVVLPLFLPAEIEDLRVFDRDWSEAPVHLGLDEHGRLGWALFRSGSVEVFRVDDGRRRARAELFAPGTMRAWSFSPDGEDAVFGLADGSVQLADIRFEVEVLQPGDLDVEARARLGDAAESTVVDFEDGVLERIPGNQVRRERLDIRLGERLTVGAGPVLGVTRGPTSSGIRVAAWVASPAPTGAPDEAPAPRLVAVTGEEQADFLTGKTTMTFGAPVELPPGPAGAGPPDWLGLAAAATDLYLLWKGGGAVRIALAEPRRAFVAEHGRLLPGDARLTAQAFVLGRNTLVWGDDQGRLEAGFQIRLADFDGAGVAGLHQTPEATSLLVATKHLAGAGGAVQAIAASARTRVLLAAFGDRSLRLYNVTNHSQLARAPVPVSSPVEVLAFGPRENVLALATARQLVVGGLDVRYSEASFGALFRPTWYEGYAEPIHSWQSSAGSDDFEPKHSLMPLIFGTLKATLYSMLFGAPLALLAALFTSELLAPRARSVIKPTIELMASLPSVVLGFLAALVIAPFVENVVPAVLASLVALPLAFLLGAYAWQMLPQRLSLRLERWRFFFLVLAVPLGVLLAMLLGPLAERELFAGDLKAWLAWDPRLGADRPQLSSAAGGWLFVTFPAAAAIVWYVINRFANQRLRQLAAAWRRARHHAADFVKFLLGLVAAAALALAAAYGLDALGFDPRGAFVDTYIQRNALIVGFVMGFAIIPIIYTIAEDALGAVPDHLRSASLGAGATRWQTAVRIILPTAASGLFSAVMIGLGRAVGETMIVLMAAGNTPVMEWNIFEGFRTLSANIAVELPEAVVGGTHYRTLFVAALVLFVMTFVVNTLAEAIRLRFRRRAYQL